MPSYQHLLLRVRRIAAWNGIASRQRGAARHGLTLDPGIELWSLPLFSRYATKTANWATVGLMNDKHQTYLFALTGVQHQRAVPERFGNGALQLTTWDQQSRTSVPLQDFINNLRRNGDLSS